MTVAMIMVNDGDDGDDGDIDGDDDDDEKRCVNTERYRMWISF
jgi:hypothetical protein